MTRSIGLLFLLIININVECSISFGYFDSAAYIPTNFTNVLSYNGTCSKCICFAFFSSIPPIYVALNCYKNNNTCLLFTNFLSRSNIRINTNSSFVFVQQSNTTAVSCTMMYYQCGGTGFTGSTSCCNGSSCIFQNSSYSECLETSGVITSLTSTESVATISYTNDSRQIATISHYWGCCKASCSWPGKATVTNPVQACEQDGSTAAYDNDQSVCDSGDSYMCTNQQPWNVSDTLSYGYAGASLIGQNESYWCCNCYSLLFTSGAIAGKELIVQVTNTAYESYNLFVLQIPGGGWGSTSNGCSVQFSGSYSWGQQYGGVSNRSECANLPTVLQEGCYWQFDWFMNANNITTLFKQVTCPSALTTNTGCIRI